jgi:hypothetical protein
VPAIDGCHDGRVQRRPEATTLRLQIDEGDWLVHETLPDEALLVRRRSMAEKRNVAACISQARDLGSGARP